MSYSIDKDLEEGIKLIKEGKKINTALKLINKSARTGTTKGKSYFEVGRIIREGIVGLSANPEEAKKYYNSAMEHFLNEPCDSLDYHYMGDYYNYGYGSEPIDKNLALTYYDKAANEGDEEAKKLADELRESLKTGAGNVSQSLNPETVAKEDASDENQAEVEASNIIFNENDSAQIKDDVLAKEIDSDQILLKALKVLDDSEASKEEKLDAVELLKIASENGSIRALVLLGYLYEGDNSLVEQDYTMSLKYYTDAISRGSSSALFRLGILYTDKEVPYYDLEKGQQMIIKAARLGYSFALTYIGDCFRLKVDDNRNLEVAYRYYALAGERGLGLAYHYMAEIDASRQELDLADKHEKLALNAGYEVSLGYQDPLFYSLRI